MSKERFEWLYNEKVLKHYMVDNQNNIQLGYEAIVNLLNQQNKQIADLEAKLAEMQNEKDELISKYRYWKGECAELKEQLAEKDKAIENWRYMYEGVMQSCHNGIEEDKRLEKLLAEKEAEIEKWKSMAERSSSVLDRFNYCGESIIYNTTREKDKISFAVDILEELADCSNYIDSKLDFESGSYVSEKSIRDKIKYLKGNKYE